VSKFSDSYGSADPSQEAHPGGNFGAAPGALSQSAASAGATAQALGFASKIMSHL